MYNVRVIEAVNPPAILPCGLGRYLPLISDPSNDSSIALLRTPQSIGIWMIGMLIWLGLFLSLAQQCTLWILGPRPQHMARYDPDTLLLSLSRWPKKISRTTSDQCARTASRVVFSRLPSKSLSAGSASSLLYLGHRLCAER